MTAKVTTQDILEFARLQMDHAYHRHDAHVLHGEKDKSLVDAGEMAAWRRLLDVLEGKS